MDNNKELIELRNEKMRSIVGKSPSYLLRSGIYIISLFILSFIFCLYLLPFTDSYSTKIIIKSYPQIDSLFAPIGGLLAYSITSDDTIESEAIVATISNDFMSKEVNAKSVGRLLKAQKNNVYIDKGELICSIIPLGHDKDIVCGEFYLPIRYKPINLKKCEIIITAERGKTITGRIAYIYPSVYSLSNKQYIRIRINICDDTYLLLPTEGEVKIVFFKQSLLTLTF